MSVLLTRPEYRAACSYAEPWLAGERWGLMEIGGLTGQTRGVYLLTAPCPISGRPRVCYVGKADRTAGRGDVGERIAEHLKGSKGPLVRWATVIPLLDAAPASEVLRIEGDVARYFGVPRLCRAVPGGRRARG